MKDNSKDPRTDRSREQLHVALVKLTLERGWQGYNVKELCEQAGVSRSTFYVHFADKEDVLVHGLDIVYQRICRSADSSPGSYVAALTEHVRDARPLLQAVLTKKVGVAALEKFRTVVLYLVARDLSGHFSNVDEALTRFIAGGLVELLRWWAESDAPIRRVRDQYERLTHPLLANLEGADLH